MSLFVGIVLSLILVAWVYSELSLPWLGTFRDRERVHAWRHRAAVVLGLAH